ncbi:unnamed protein product [Clonostachys solani]|uniref:Uncharacterized protein n=1 Tax=Clonostachys solani TaxID=160281 RepID=A0A9N9Z230_9HYPO|nr:unnamed protein product [Clonostachys solani]
MADLPPANTAQKKRKYATFESSQAQKRDGSPSEPFERPVQPANAYILSLAPELLGEIFSNFQHPSLYENKILVEDIDRPLPESHLRALQSSRRVCCLFNSVATPLMLPILRVQVDKESLDRVQKIAGHPLMSAGVRGIQILMSCRLRSFALDKSEFIGFLQATMNDMLDRQSMGLALMVARGDNESHQLALDHRAAKESPAYDRTRACLLACGRILGRDAPLPPIRSMPSLRGQGFREAIVGLVAPSLIDDYQQMLDHVHEEYRKQYERDLPVISQGLLVQALAKVVSTPHRTISLSFNETLSDVMEEETEEIFAGREITALWLNNPIKPSDCHKYQQYIQREDMAPYTALFWDLPIAIRQTGSSVNSLELHGPVIDYQHSILCPGGGSVTSHALVLNQLHMALQNLHTFILPELYVLQPTRRTPFAMGHIDERAPGGITIAQYLSAVLSSRNLQKLELNPSPSEADVIFRQPRPSEVGHTLSQIRCEYLRVVALHNIKITQQELEAFCIALSPDIEFLELAGISLTQGSWAPILDLLRDLLRERCVRGVCEVELEHLNGDEMEQVLTNVTGDPNAFLRDLLDQFMGYIRGDGVHSNPLVELGPF